MSCKLLFLALVVALVAMDDFGSCKDAARTRPFHRPKCGRRMLTWLKRRFKENFPTKFLLPPPMNPHYAKNFGKSPGCKLPFHDGMFQCCRLARGDCHETTITKIRNVNRVLNRCLKSHKSLRRCWIEAEKSEACARSYYGAYNMKKVSGGMTW